MIIKLMNNKILLALVILVLFTAGCAQELTQQAGLVETGITGDTPENIEDMAAGRATQYIYNQYLRMQNDHNSAGNLIVDLYASISPSVTSSTVVSWRLYKNGSYYKYLGSTVGKKYIRTELATPMDAASYKVYALVDNPSSSDFIVCWSKTVNFQNDVKYRTMYTNSTPNRWYAWAYDGESSFDSSFRLYPIDALQIDVLLNNYDVYYQVAESYKGQQASWSATVSNGATCGTDHGNSTSYINGISPVEKIVMWVTAYGRDIRYRLWNPYATDLRDTNGWTDWFYNDEEDEYNDYTAGSIPYDTHDSGFEECHKYIYAIDVEFIC